MNYIAKTGLNYPSKSTGEEVRVEKGDIISDMLDDDLAAEIEAGNVAAEEKKLNLDEALSQAIQDGIEEIVEQAQSEFEAEEM